MQARAVKEIQVVLLALSVTAAVAATKTPIDNDSPVPLSREAFAHVVRDGALRERGMPAFQELTDEQLDSLRHFVRQKARDSAAPAQKSN